MPWTNVYPGVIQAVTVIIQGGTQSGIFVYAGTPATGTLTGSWTATAGTDAYGNAYASGLTVYEPFSTSYSYFTQITMSKLLFHFNNSSYFLQPGEINATEDLVNSKSPLITMLSPTDRQSIGAANQAVVEAGGLSFDGTSTPFVKIVGVDQNQTLQAIPLIASGGVIGWHPGTTSTETWNTPTLGAGWAIGPNSGTVQPLQYRLDPTGDLIIVGAIHTTSTTPSTTIFTLPAGYIPAITQRSPGVTNRAGSITADFVEVNSSGSVSIVPALTTSSTDAYFQVKVPLGIIA